ncbi:Amidase family protein [Oxytricha trifallax]|uniref:Amidase family protein n=1 Tax=Oxytricha trifallax TaxID=1172189 RepID=A0A073HWW0_9SPIT|nr:Amidase family protein [Oxytricha trifallax]
MAEQGSRGILKDNILAFTQIKIAGGPMAKSVNDLVIGFKTIQQANIHKKDIFAPPPLLLDKKLLTKHSLVTTELVIAFLSPLLRPVFQSRARLEWSKMILSAKGSQLYSSHFPTAKLRKLRKFSLDSSQT